MMENIESSVYSFKENEKVKFNEYLNEEKLLLKEIEANDKKFDIWLNQKNNGFKSERSHSTTNLKEFIENNGSELLPEVITFDVNIRFREKTGIIKFQNIFNQKFLLQNGGHKGGWDEYDHNIFLKIRLKNKVRIFYEKFFSCLFISLK